MSKHVKISFTERPKEWSLTECKLHKKKPLELYCVTDQEAICDHCERYGKHRGHEVRLMEQVAEDNRKNLEKLMAMSREDEKKLESLTQQDAAALQELSTRSARASAQVAAHMAALQQAIKQRADQLLQDIQTLTEKRADSIHTRRKNIALTLSQVTASAEHIAHALSRGTGVDPVWLLGIAKSADAAISSAHTATSQWLSQYSAARTAFDLELPEHTLPALISKHGRLIALADEAEPPDKKLESKQPPVLVNFKWERCGSAAVCSGRLLTSNGPGASYASALGDLEMKPNTGLYFWEVHVSNIGNSAAWAAAIGVATVDLPLDGYLSKTDSGWAYVHGGVRAHDSGTYANAYGATYTTGDTIGVVFNSDIGSLSFLKNQVDLGIAYTGIRQIVRPAAHVQDGSIIQIVQSPS
jgi:hypothetical protein